MFEWALVLGRAGDIRNKPIEKKGKIFFDEVWPNFFLFFKVHNVKKGSHLHKAVVRRDKSTGQWGRYEGLRFKSTILPKVSSYLSSVARKKVR